MRRDSARPTGKKIAIIKKTTLDRKRHAYHLISLVHSIAISKVEK
jgi:hypothetical protein